MNPVDEVSPRLLN